MTPRLYTKYTDEVRSRLQEQFKYQNVMQMPKLAKVVINIGVNEAKLDQKYMPKRGFSNFFFAVKYATVNVEDLDARFEAGADIDAASLAALRLISSADKPVKILGEGEITKNLTVHANAFSASAVKKIEAAGGKAEVIK